MSCILYNKGAYIKLQQNSQLANTLAIEFLRQPLANFLFDLNAEAYATRYGRDDSQGDITQAREDVETSDYEFELKDWNDPTELHNLLKRIEYQCADIHTAEHQDDQFFNRLVAMRKDCERRMAHPIYIAETKRKTLEAQAAAAIVKANDKDRFIKELREQYPWAKSPNVSRNIKKELSLTFPNVKFSVRMRHHGSICISWVDGPTTKQVEAVSDKYESGRFDGMTDSYSYDRSAYGDAVAVVLGRSQYVQTSRSLSARFLRDVTLDVCFEYHHNTLPIVKGGEKSAYVERTSVPYCPNANYSLDEWIHRTAHERVA
jgi:hypothetical protein